MENRFPGPLREAVERLSSLPGVGPKSALRMAMALLRMPEDQARAVGQSVIELRERLCVCERCASLADASPCPICADPSRDRDQLCLVADWDTLLALEDMGQYRGQYFVLGGLVSPLEGVGPDRIGVSRLRDRLAQGEVAELILALGATLESEHTASYIRDLVEREFPGLRVTRLAQGIPFGAEVKYMDKETLKQSLIHRQRM